MIFSEAFSRQKLGFPPGPEELDESIGMTGVLLSMKGTDTRLCQFGTVTKTIQMPRMIHPACPTALHIWIGFGGGPAWCYTRFN